MEYLQAITIGLLGSFHCIGMCGPLALALPLSDRSTGSRVISALLYNSGRIMTYAALGLIFGLLGKGINVWGFQRWVSILLGLIMILAVFSPLLFRSLHIESHIDSLLAGFKRVFARFFSTRSLISILFIGLLNGLLPCGLVYLALAGALVSNTPFEGGLYMLMFGLGTIPALLAVLMIGNVFGIAFRNRVKRIIPVMVVVIGLLFILRGLNLGIPYLSPEMKPRQEVPACCH